MPTRVHRGLLVAAVVMIVLVIVGTTPAVLVWFFWPCTAITRANMLKLEHGMPRAEVEAILGGPARDERSQPLAEEQRIRIGGGLRDPELGDHIRSVHLNCFGKRTGPVFMTWESWRTDDTEFS